MKKLFPKMILLKASLRGTILRPSLLAFMLLYQTSNIFLPNFFLSSCSVLDDNIDTIRLINEKENSKNNGKAAKEANTNQCITEIILKTKSYSKDFSKLSSSHRSMMLGTSLFPKTLANEDEQNASIIKCVDLLFFNDDQAGRLDSYQRIENIKNNKIRGVSTVGSKILVVIANCGKDRMKWGKIGSYKALCETKIQLEDDSVLFPIMSCEQKIRAGIDESCTIELEALMSKITLKSIKCDLRNSCFKGEKLNNVKVYLTNVNASCGILKKKNFEVQDILNSGQLLDKDISNPKLSKLLLKTLKNNIDEEEFICDVNLYCYPNDIQKERLGQSFTRLVIEGDIKGNTYYYPININRKNFIYGSDNTELEDDSEEIACGIKRNREYSIKVSIERPGMTNPDTPAVSNMYKIEFENDMYKDKGESIVTFSLDPSPYENKSILTRSVEPPTNKISDINIFIFDERAVLVERKYIDLTSGYSGSSKNPSCKFKLLEGNKYSAFFCANIGEDITERITTAEELKNYRFYMTYPDEYQNGMPLATEIQNFIAHDKNFISVKLKPLLSKINIKVNRSALDSDVNLKIKSVKIGNCPSSSLLFNKNVVSETTQIYTKGFFKHMEEVANLNSDLGGKISGSVALFMFENIQGTNKSSFRSYLELKCNYQSKKYKTFPDEYLIYRFYFGEGESKYDIERASEYTFVIKPMGDGLSINDDWRVDKTDLRPVTG